MSPRRYSASVTCSRPGCNANGHFDAYSRADELRIYRDHAKTWLCHEHRNEDIRLSAGRPSIRWVSEPSNTHDGCGDSLFWSHSGLLHGPGFEVRANDFPPGTVIEVTVRAIVPDTSNGD